MVRALTTDLRRESSGELKRAQMIQIWHGVVTGGRGFTWRCSPTQQRRREAAGSGSVGWGGNGGAVRWERGRKGGWGLAL
jgi:hypothetical protein